RRGQCVARGDGQLVGAGIRGRSAKERLGWLTQRQLAERVLDGDLPGAGGRDEANVGPSLDLGARSRGEPVGVACSPQQDVRDQEEPHVSPSKARSASSGRGASKSSGTSTRPRRVPSCGFREIVPSAAAGSSSTTMTSTIFPSIDKSSGMRRRGGASM